MGWKHDFTIVTKDKTFELLANSKFVMEELLFGFSNVIQKITDQTLFSKYLYINELIFFKDWKQYNGSNSGSLTYVGSLTSPQFSQGLSNQIQETESAKETKHQKNQLSAQTDICNEIEEHTYATPLYEKLENYRNMNNYNFKNCIQGNAIEKGPRVAENDRRNYRDFSIKEESQILYYRNLYQEISLVESQCVPGYRNKGANNSFRESKILGAL